MDQAIAEIRSCRFLIADVTGTRGGVCFEAGWAMALNKPVVWLCREDQKHSIHFDVEHYNHIYWYQANSMALD